MTPETQTLVDRLREWVDGQSVTYASVLMEDAAAALTSLARDLSQAHAWLGECYAMTGADPDDNEDWRLAPHAVEEVQRLSRDLETARQERDAAQSNYDGACRTIALMHEAATGRSGEGPHLGVVEDVAAAVRAARAETWAKAAKGLREVERE